MSSYKAIGLFALVVSLAGCDPVPVPLTPAQAAANRQAGLEQQKQWDAHNAWCRQSPEHYNACQAEKQATANFYQGQINGLYAQASKNPYLCQNGNWQQREANC
jgi:hypothetical protein